MSEEVMTANCSRCFKRRRLRLAHTSASGGEFWFCRGCSAEYASEQATADIWPRKGSVTMRDPIDTWFTALLVGILVLTLAAVAAADLRDQRRCERSGGRVLETQHGWRCAR